MNIKIFDYRFVGTYPLQCNNIIYISNAFHSGLYPVYTEHKVHAHEITLPKYSEFILYMYASEFRVFSRFWPPHPTPSGTNRLISNSHQ